MSCEHNKAMTCQCTNDKCNYRGKCCDCVANHIRRGDSPACLRSKEAEKK